MPQSSVAVTMPSYVLKDGSQPIGPVVTKPESGLVVVVTYCFSSRRIYDAFLVLSKQRLSPYPLTKGFLRNQVNESSDQLRLLAMDAVGPCSAELRAATMQSVLNARQENLSQVDAEYLLVFDQEAASYRLTTSPSDSAFEQTEATNLT